MPADSRSAAVPHFYPVGSTTLDALTTLAQAQGAAALYLPAQKTLALVKAPAVPS